VKKYIKKEKCIENEVIWVSEECAERNEADREGVRGGNSWIFARDGEDVDSELFSGEKSKNKVSYVDSVSSVSGRYVGEGVEGGGEDIKSKGEGRERYKGVSVSWGEEEGEEAGGGMGFYSEYVWGGGKSKE
jgi:hypothetical protein